MPYNPENDISLSAVLKLEQYIEIPVLTQLYRQQKLGPLKERAGFSEAITYLFHLADYTRRYYLQLNVSGAGCITKTLSLSFSQHGKISFIFSEIRK
jgi:hypothetical protein